MKARKLFIYLLCSVFTLILTTGSVLGANWSVNLKSMTDVDEGDFETVRAFINGEAPADITYSWQSSNDSIVQVVSGNGHIARIKGVTQGSAELTVTATAGGEVQQASCTVIVEPDRDYDDDWDDDDWDDDDWDDHHDSYQYIPVSSVELNLTTATVPIGKELELDETVLPRNASDKDVRWSSSDPIVARVSSDGDVLGLTTGTVTITVETYDGGKTATCTVTVVEASVVPGLPNNNPAQSPGNTSPTPVQPSVQPSPGFTNPTTKYQIYRLYLPANNEHLYTSDPGEVTTLEAQGWSNENVGWNSPMSGEPVYRLFSPKTLEHHYTKDPVEVEVLAASGVWTIDNGGQPLFYSGGDKPIYRLYHEGTQRHHLTTDVSEYNALGANGWKQEGAALYSID